MSSSLSFPAQGAPQCTGSVVWLYSPVHLTGTDGIGTAVRHNTSVNTFPSSGNCTASDLVGDLRVGTWQISEGAGPYSGQCSADLHVGSNVATFTSGVCKIQPFVRRGSARTLHKA